MRCPLVVGGPVHRRAWVLDEFFDSVEAQDLPDGTRFIFALSEEGDPSEGVILRRRPDAEVVFAPGPAADPEDPDDSLRIQVLAGIRNQLLRLVQGLDPERFLSWDSDIVLRPEAYRELTYAVGERDVAGALVDMGGRSGAGPAWSWMVLSGRDAFRPPRATSRDPFPPHPDDETIPTFYAPFQVGVVMGVKLLSRYAYRSARYADHVLGEDVAFCCSCEALGIPRWLVPDARGEHRHRLA